MIFSDFTELISIGNDDEFILLRPIGGGVYTNSRAKTSTFLSSVLALFGTDSISWASVNKTGSNLSDLANRSHTSLTDIGSNTHAQIDAFMAAHSAAKIITFAPVESDFDIRIKDGTVAFTVPAILNGYNLTTCIASVHTPGSGVGATLLQVRRRRSGTDADMLATRISLAENIYFASNGVVNTSYDDLQTGDQIYVDVDQLTETAPKGLSVALTFNI
jgi:hypothetical protein